MKHKVLFISKADFVKNYNNQNGLSNSACISIVDPTEAYKPNISDKWQASLRIEMYDADTEENSCFTDQEAGQILDFIRLVQDCQIKNLIIHCHAGISRSAAVAKMAALILDADYPEHYSLYNKFVYSKLLLNYTASQVPQNSLQNFNTSHIKSFWQME